MSELPSAYAQEVSVQLPLGMNTEDMMRYNNRAIELFNEAKYVTNEMLINAYNKGTAFWKRLHETWAELSKGTSVSGNVLAIKRKKDTTGGTTNPLMKQFMDFAKGFDVNASVMHIFVGEGNAILDAGKYIPQDCSVHLACGPIMVKTNSDTPNTSQEECFHNFIQHLLTRECDDDVYLEISLNRFPSFYKGFAGYYHCFVYGNAVFFEEPHKLGDMLNKDGFFLYDKQTAEMVLNYFEDYEKEYSYSLEEIDELYAFLPTFQKSKYMKLFDDSCTNRLVEVGIRDEFKERETVEQHTKYAHS